MADPKNENERLIRRINKVFKRLSDDPASGDDKRVLAYVRSQLKPEAIAKRPVEDQSVTHLQEVAKARLKPYEKEANPA